MKVLSEQMLRCLSPQDREALGQSTKEESRAIGEARSEKELQKLIYSELLRRGLFFHYSRMDRKTTSGRGTPDFGLCLNGQYVAVEAKSATGNLTMRQIHRKLQINSQGGSFYVVRSFDEFLSVLKINGL